MAQLDNGRFGGGNGVGSIGGIQEPLAIVGILFGIGTPFFRTHEDLSADRTTIAGRLCINFSCGRTFNRAAAFLH